MEPRRPPEGARWRWLESTVELQRDVYGLDPDEYHYDPDGMATAVKENVLALIVEAVELLNEVKWKYWSHEEPWVRRARVLKEAVDIGHFQANILTAIGVTDQEYWEAYQAKQQENRDRQEQRYVSEQAKENG